MFTLIITSAVLGQCYAPQRAANYGYRQQTYTQAYVQPTYAATQYQATAYFQADPGYFAASVAAYTKKQIADAAALQAQTDLAVKLAKLDETVGKLTVQFGQALQPDPAPQPQQPYAAPLASPQAPQYATPQAPDKATPPVPGKASYGSYPDAGYVAPPPVPGKASYGYGSPSYGAVPPPPAALGSPGDSDAIASAAMQRNRCVKCHTGGGAAGGFTIFDAPGRLAQLTDADRAAIVRAVDERRMPPRKEGVRVSPADQAAIYGLSNAGSPIVGSPIAGTPRSGY